MEQRWNKFAGHGTLPGFDIAVTRLHWCWSLCCGPEANSLAEKAGKYMPTGTYGHRGFMVVYRHHLQEIAALSLWACRAVWNSRDLRKSLIPHPLPLSLGQAGRIPGVSPADVTALLLWLELRKRQSSSSPARAGTLTPNI